MPTERKRYYLRSEARLNDYAYMIMYLISVCAFAREIAKYKSFLGVRISIKARYALLIFSRIQPKISVICLISQIYAYTMIFLFILSRFVSFDFLYYVTSDPNTLFTNMLKSHFVIFPVGILEVGICKLVRRHQKLE